MERKVIELASAHKKGDANKSTAIKVTCFINIGCSNEAWY